MRPKFMVVLLKGGNTVETTYLKGTKSALIIIIFSNKQ